MAAACQRSPSASLSSLAQGNTSIRRSTSTRLCCASPVPSNAFAELRQHGKILSILPSSQAGTFPILRECSLRGNSLLLKKIPSSTAGIREIACVVVKGRSLNAVPGPLLHCHVACPQRGGGRAEVRTGAHASGGADLDDDVDLSVVVNGLHLENPFVIGSGPPGTNYTVMKKAFDEGWGGVICKTLSLDSSKVINVTPRYARMRAPGSRDVIGWENIELISDRPLEVMLSELRRLKEEYPNRILIGSIMEEYNRGAWEEIVGRVEETGVDALEINFSCPHGLPERRMGMAMGQDCEVLGEVCGWINKVATVPVWAKMTPNITDIRMPARTALLNGCEGVSAINTITSVMGVNLQTLRPEPSVEGYSTPGGYSSLAVKPIALAKVMAISQLIATEFNATGNGLSVDHRQKDYQNTSNGEVAADSPRGQVKQAQEGMQGGESAGVRYPTVSGIGGVDTGSAAAEFILLGCSTVQVCTGVMVHGYSLVKQLKRELASFMRSHNFKTIADFQGHSLPYFTTHKELVRMQKEALEKKRAEKKGLKSDDGWTGDGFVKETETMVSN